MKNRRDGKLKALKGSYIPKYMIFFDTETHIVEDENGNIKFPFRLGCAIYVELDNAGKVKTREILRFNTTQEFNSFVKSKERQRKTLYIFAHNIAFDLRVCSTFDSFINIDYKSEPPILNNMVFIWACKHEKAKITFLDTANFGVTSVRELGADLGFPKLSIDFSTLNNDELYEYCLRDVSIIEKFMLELIQFIRKHGLGKFSITLASQAMKAFRTSFYNEDIWLHSHYGALQLERDAYFGGRTEIFRYGYVGYQDYYMLDVNSMYPYAMTAFPIPVKFVKYREKLHPDYLEKFMENYYVIADCDVEIAQPFIPLRLSNDSKTYNYLHNPYSEQYPQLNSNRIIFPTGKFRTCCHHQELLMLMEFGNIHKIHRIALYEKGNPFNEYVDFFYGLKKLYKQENNLSWRYIAKLFLNSLYGKFGQLEPHRRKVGIDTEYRFNRVPFSNDIDGIYGSDLTWNSIIYREYKQGETTFSNPAIAGSITANARITLYRYMELAGRGNVYYCDTDSIITNSSGYSQLSNHLDKLEMGKLDTQKKAKRLIIRGNKDYRLGDKRTHKGLNATARKVGKNLWRYIQFEGFITSWKKHDLTSMEGFYARKGRKSEYQKGIILDDNSVTPFKLREF